jgi:hypothetical protein
MVLFLLHWGVWTQGLTLARQAFYSWATSPTVYFLRHFTMSSRLPLNLRSSSSASWVLRLQKWTTTLSLRFLGSRNSAASASWAVGPVCYCAWPLLFLDSLFLFLLTQGVLAQAHLKLTILPPLLPSVSFTSALSLSPSSGDFGFSLLFFFFFCLVHLDCWFGISFFFPNVGFTGINFLLNIFASFHKLWYAVFFLSFSQNIF